MASGLSAAKQSIRWFGVVLSGVAVLFASLSYWGFWDFLRGDDLLIGLAQRLDTSYAEVSRQVRPVDPEWEPLMRVITHYTHADLPKNRQPVVFARFVAVSSFKTDAGEWTAPTTPMALLYKQWPAPGTGPFKINQDAWIVGTLGDLHEWIRRDEGDFDFVWRTIIFGALSVCVGAFLALPDRTSKVGGEKRL